MLPRLLNRSNPGAKPAQLADWRPTGDSGDGGQAFVVYQDERGDVTCRKATADERRRIVERSGGGPTKVIYSGAPRREDLPDETAAWTSDATTGLTLQASAGLRIVLHGTTQLEENQTAKNAFIVAANRWEAIVSTPITVVIDVDFGPTFFGQPYDSPNILGATGVDTVVGPFPDLRQRLIDRSSTAAEQQLYNALPASAVPIELGGITTSDTNAEATGPNARALGIVPDITDPDSVALGQGDAGIGFNSGRQFDFDPADGISSTLTDFDSVASHEIGHALGFISNAGVIPSSPAVWDLFRFRPGTANLSTFATAPRVMNKGGEQVFFGNHTSTFATLELALSTGGPDPGAGDGDGRQSSHWKDDELLSTRPYIGIMDPTLIKGIRRTISENDIAALDLLGYSIGAPAPVRPPNDNFVNATVLQTNSSTLTGTNVSATRETGEPNHVGFMGDKSVWYSWVSPLNGQMTIDTIGSGFDTTLAVYTGPAVNQLGNVAQNDDIVAGSNKVSRVQFNITAGTTYRIVVDGWNGEYGNVSLNWNATGSLPTPTPTPTPSPSPTPTPTPGPPCLDDNWTPTSMSNAPVGRWQHTAVWTGSEMIVWGGQDPGGQYLNTGARYNPNTNTWTVISSTNAPTARLAHSAVWTGTEMIVWGGVGSDNSNSYLNTGGRYNPSSDSWSAISSVNAPTKRINNSAIWTGSEMIIWGGSGDVYTNTGGRYNPVNDTWTPTSTNNAPSVRHDHSTVWTGTEMIVWGGLGVTGTLNSGGRYNPNADSWTATSMTGAPSVRRDHSAVWAGDEMVIWGGGDSIVRTKTGARYKPGTDSWTPTNTSNAPAGRGQHVAFWTGAEMIVWGGTDNSTFLRSGGRYRPATDSWIAACEQNAPPGSVYSAAVWTGSEMIFWGGVDNSNHRLDTGGRYSIQSAPVQLMLDTSGPAVDQAATLDSVLLTRDPFPVINGADLLNLGSDRNTRVILFVMNLQLAQGEASSSVVVNLIDGNNQSYDLPAEDVRSIANPNFTQVIFRLPNNLPVGTCVVKVNAHGQLSNAGTLRIRL